MNLKVSDIRIYEAEHDDFWWSEKFRQVNE